MVASWLAKITEHAAVDNTSDEEGMLINAVPVLLAESVMDRTPFRSVRRVRAGRAVQLDPPRELRYWNPDMLPEVDMSLTLTDCVELLREGLEQAIRRVLPLAGGVGAHVSGGVDSTAVACRANHILRDRGSGLVACYSWSPHEYDVPAFDGDERPLLDDVAVQERLAVTLLRDDDPIDDFETLDPDTYPWPIETREAFVYPRARADGVRVMLNGFGGDEAASARGFGVRRELVRRGRLDEIAMAAWQEGTIKGRGARDQWRSVTGAVGGAVLDVLPAPAGALRHPWTAAARHRKERIAEAALQRYPAAAAARRERIDTYRAIRGRRDAMTARLLVGYLQQRITAWYQRGRLYGIDYRYPLLDLDLLSDVARMPWYAFSSHGWSRPAFRLAIEPWVPASVAWNPSKAEPAHMGSLTHAPKVRRRPPDRERLISEVWLASAPYRAPARVRGTAGGMQRLAG